MKNTKRKNPDEDSAMSNIEERLARLERQSRRWRFSAFALAGLSACAVLWACQAEKPQPQPVVLKAQQFVLIDSNGRTQGGLAVGTDGPTFSLLDSNGKER